MWLFKLYRGTVVLSCTRGNLQSKSNSRALPPSGYREVNCFSDIDRTRITAVSLLATNSVMERNHGKTGGFKSVCRTGKEWKIHF